MTRQKHLHCISRIILMLLNRNIHIELCCTSTDSIHTWKTPFKDQWH